MRYQHNRFLIHEEIWKASCVLAILAVVSFLLLWWDFGKQLDALAKP